MYCCCLRCAARAISCDGRGGATEDTTETTFAVQVLHDIENTLILSAALSLSLDLVHVVSL